MKKKTIKRILLTCGIIGIGTASVLVLRNVNGNLKKEANIDIYEKDDIYGDDYKKIVRDISFGANYNVTYSNEDESIKDVEAPTKAGKWKATIDIKENLLYKSSTYIKEFNYHEVSNENINKFFDVGEDSWGGTADNLSVKCSKDNVFKTDNYTKLMIDKDNDTSACLDSKFTMFDGTFKTMFKTNLSDYGTFALWLTGVENEKNTYKEVTIELCSNNKVTFGSATNMNDYKSEEKTLDINYSDEFWHSLELSYNHETKKADVKLDNELIYTFDSNLPTMEYLKPHIGLLYPTNPSWSGTKTRKQNYAYVSNYEAYKTNGEAQ